MKDSGVDWLGEIPAHWNLTKISMVYDERRTKVSDKNFMPLSVTKNGIVPQLESAAKTDNGDNRKLILKGDFVINSRSDRRGSCGISQYDGSCSLINTVLIPRQEMCNGFYGFVFKSEPFADEFYKWGHGIVDDLWSTKWSDMKRIKIPFPPLEEQKKIAAYLDKKCSAIDSAVDAAKKMVETLAGYKKSLITETVTKGLNPSAKMKDSGVEWLGKIPAHWKISKLKYLFKIFSGTTPNTDKEYYWGGNIFWITPADFKSKNKFVSKGHKNLTELGVKDYGLRLIPPNSLIFSKRAPIGEVAITSAELTINQGCLACIPKKISDTKYYYYLLSILNEPFNFFGAGTTFKEISLSNFERFSVILPPIDEQKKIAAFLDRKCSAIDESISAHKNLAEKLSEYKKSLIYEVVTGKISV